MRPCKFCSGESRRIGKTQIRFSFRKFYVTSTLKSHFYSYGFFYQLLELSLEWTERYRDPKIIYPKYWKHCNHCEKTIVAVIVAMSLKCFSARLQCFQ